MAFFSGVTTPGASVTVNYAGGSTAVIYANTGLTTTLSNPITASSLTGVYAFYAQDGLYDITNGSAGGNLTGVWIGATPKPIKSADDITVLPNASKGLSRQTLQAMCETVNYANANNPNIALNSVSVSAYPYLAVGDGVTDDTTAIQAALTYCTNNAGKVCVFDKTKTYKVTSTLTSDCDIDGTGAILDYGNDFNSVAWTVGPASGSSVRRTLKMPDIQTGRTTPTGWTNTNGVGLKCVNLASCDIWMGKMSGWFEGLQITNADASGTIYNNFFLRHFQSCKVCVHLLCANGGWVNSNRFYNGRMQWSGGISNGQTGSYSVWIQGQVSGHDANNNEFYGIGTEGDINQYAILIQGGTYNNFYGPRLEQTTPTFRCEGITGNDALRNKIILGYATGGITMSNGALGYDNWIWTPNTFAVQCGGDNAGFQLANRSGDTNYIFTLWGSADKDIVSNPGSATTWLTRIAAGWSDYKLAANSQPKIRIDAQGGGKIIFGDGSTAITSGAYFSVYNANAGIKVTTGDFAMGTAGKGLRVTEGSNCKQGTATLTAGSVVVSNTSVTASSRIFLTSNADGGTPGFLRVSARSAGTSFTITSSSGTDTSTVAYQIFEPA